MERFYKAFIRCVQNKTLRFSDIIMKTIHMWITLLPLCVISGIGFYPQKKQPFIPRVRNVFKMWIK
jgi:hypothetical protein